MCLPRGKGDWEFGIGRCKLLYLECINNKVLLNSTGDYIHSPEIWRYIYNIWIYVTESLCYIVEIETTLYINYTLA